MPEGIFSFGHFFESSAVILRLPDKESFLLCKSAHIVENEEI